MNILKLITSLLLTILPVSILIRDWKFHDKRTKKHHNITRGIIIFWCIGSIAVTYFVWTDSAQIRELVDGKNTLIRQNTSLAGKIENYQKDLNEKDKKIKKLEEKAIKAERGITSTYDFNGAKRETSGGRNTAIAGEEMGIFTRMEKLKKNENYPELIVLCENQIKKTPDWLTPFLYLGIGYDSMGNRDKAISNLEYVITHAPGDPAYAQAKIILEQIRKQ